MSPLADPVYLKDGINPIIEPYLSTHINGPVAADTRTRYKKTLDMSIKSGVCRRSEKNTMMA